MLTLASLSSPGAAQPRMRRPDGPITEADRKAALQGLAEALRQQYVFPDAGERYASMLLHKLAAGAYRATTAVAFAEAVNRDLQAIRKDGHLHMDFDPDFKPRPEGAEPTPEERERYRKAMAWMGYGIDKVERLPGNVGLLTLRGFLSPAEATPALASAMNLLSTTDALIIDLRENGGGHPDTVAFLCSYFFSPGQSIHINDLYDRPKNETHQYWTITVPGVPYLGKPVYVLTSEHTFSAAEEFSYDMQTQKRATIVGQTTGGGAHPGDVVAVGGGFVAFVPNGRAINPITKTNWEGVGVKPDVAAPAAQALKVAHLAALRALHKAEQDRDRRTLLDEVISSVEKGEPPGPVRRRR